jgi:nucleotide-binding universal stress UspA family protein
MPTLLLALDGSLEAEAAVPFATELAAARGFALDIVTVVPPVVDVRAVSGAPVPDASWRAEQHAIVRTSARDYLTAVREGIATQASGLAVSVAVLDGTPAATLAAHARDSGAAALVLTTHGRGGASRLWLGSVADALVRQADVPLFVVRSLDREQRGLDTPMPVAQSVAISLQTHRPALSRVMVTFDGTRAADDVIAPVRTLLGDSPLYVLTRVASPLHPMLRRIATASEYERDLAEQEHRAASYLAEHAATLRAAGVACELRVPVGMDTAIQIVEHATQCDVGLIALATHARGPLGRSLLGSVADKVLRSATVPVLLYRVAH